MTFCLGLLLTQLGAWEKSVPTVYRPNTAVTTAAAARGEVWPEAAVATTAGHAEAAAAAAVAAAAAAVPAAAAAAAAAAAEEKRPFMLCTSVAI